MTIGQMVIDCCTAVVYGGGMSNSQLLAEMRNWLDDPFPYDIPADLTDKEVLSAVGFHYDGGIDQFGKDGA